MREVWDVFLLDTLRIKSKGIVGAMFSVKRKIVIQKAESPLLE